MGLLPDGVAGGSTAPSKVLRWFNASEVISAEQFQAFAASGVVVLSDLGHNLDSTSLDESRIQFSPATLACPRDCNATYS